VSSLISVHIKQYSEYISRIDSVIRKVAEYRYTVLLLLVFAFALRLLFYLNTTQFETISEAGSVLWGIERLKQNETVYLFQGNYRYSLSYVAYFFDRVFGSLHLFFVFQCLIAMITLYFVYVLILEVSGNKVSAFIGLLLAAIYIDFALLPSVAYNQTMEIFFTVAAILIVFRLLTTTSWHTYLLLTLTFILILFTSLLFRGTLLYFYLILPIAAAYLYIFKKTDKAVAYRLAMISVLCIIFFYYITPMNLFARPDNIPINNFVFFGHTDYGGLGGEGSFVYEENQLRYEEAFNKYLEINSIENPSRTDIIEFQKQEIKSFILNQPHSWILLQIRKVIYTYGSVPIRDNLYLLMTGNVNLGLIFSTMLSQFTFMVPIMLFVLFFNWNKFKSFLRERNGFTLFIVLIYLIGATSIYGHYHERYRIVVMVCALIPFTAMFLDHHYLNSIMRDKTIFIKKMMICAVIIVVWLYQVYEALLIHGDRYLDAIRKIDDLSYLL
jgi:hypothetical protein